MIGGRTVRENEGVREKERKTHFWVGGTITVVSVVEGTPHLLGVLADPTLRPGDVIT